MVLPRRAEELWLSPGVGEKVQHHLNSLFAEARLYCLWKGSVRALEIILVHTHFPLLGVTVSEIFFFFF